MKLIPTLRDYIFPKNGPKAQVILVNTNITSLVRTKETIMAAVLTNEKVDNYISSFTFSHNNFKFGVRQNRDNQRVGHTLDSKNVTLFEMSTDFYPAFGAIKLFAKTVSELEKMIKKALGLKKTPEKGKSIIRQIKFALQMIPDSMKLEPGVVDLDRLRKNYSLSVVLDNYRAFHKEINMGTDADLSPTKEFVEAFSLTKRVNPANSSEPIPFIFNK